MGGAVSPPTFSVEVITLPVSDVDRAMRFYVDRVGFTLDVDYAPTEAFRVVQLTPPGSSCSVQIGVGLTEEPAGSVRNVYLVVTDLEAARSELVERGVAVGEIRHKTPIGGWDGGFAPGLVGITRVSPTSRISTVTAGSYRSAAIGRLDSQMAHERSEQAWVSHGSKDRWGAIPTERFSLQPHARARALHGAAAQEDERRARRQRHRPKRRSGDPLRARPLPGCLFPDRRCRAERAAALRPRNHTP